MFLAEDLGKDLDLGVRGLNPRVQVPEPSRGCRSAVALDRAERGPSFTLPFVEVRYGERVRLLL